MLKRYFWIAALLGLLPLLGVPSAAQAQAPAPPRLNLRWEPRQDLNVLLPASVRVFEANGTLPDGARIRAMYTRLALSDRNLRLRVVGRRKGRTSALKPRPRTPPSTRPSGQPTAATSGPMPRSASS